MNDLAVETSRLCADSLLSSFTAPMNVAEAGGRSRRLRVVVLRDGKGPVAVRLCGGILLRRKRAIFGYGAVPRKLSALVA